MKNICKIILALAICACLAIPFAGCDNPDKNCGGIVDSFNIEEKYIEFQEGDMLYGIVESGYYPQLTVTFKQDTTLSDDCRCSKLTIYTYDFENYGVDNLEELLINTGFLNLIQDEHRINTAWVVNNVTTPTTCLGGTDTLAYILYYDFYDEYVENPIVNDLSAYAGYVKLN